MIIKPFDVWPLMIAWVTEHHVGDVGSAPAGLSVIGVGLGRGDTGQAVSQMWPG
jgi:hypothetical protein